MGSNPTASAIRATASVCAALILTACVSVPGETTLSRGLQRDVNDRVLALARSSDPQCRQPRVLNTEILDVHGDGRSAEERWIVEQCGRRVPYLVRLPPKRGTAFSVRPEH